jgi:phosphoribosyl 1,2-cyclic phosphodiesterase
MKVWVLGSGSKGNAVLLECGASRILVDAGFPVRDLAARLAAVGVAPQSIEAAVLTHEHTDHVRGASAAAKRWGWSLLATEGTRRAVPNLAGVPVVAISPDASVTVGRFELQVVATSHDAAEPVAVVATSTATGARAGVCYDLGCVTEAVRRAFRDLDVLVLEANHDEGMLRAGPYPPSVCDRIAGRRGHLSNGAAAAMARDAAHADLSAVVLAHLSEACNEARVAAGAVSAGLAGTRFRGKVDVAPQHAAVGPFLPRLARRAPRAQQLALGL